MNKPAILLAALLALPLCGCAQEPETPKGPDTMNQPKALVAWFSATVAASVDPSSATITS